LVLTRDDDVVLDFLSDRLAANLYGSFAFYDWFSVGLDIPLILYQDGDLVQETTGFPQSLSATVMGDMRIIPKFRVLEGDKFPVAVAVLMPISLPTGDRYALAGATGNSLTFTPTVAVSRYLMNDNLLLAANLGFWLQKENSFADLETGHELFYRLGASYQLNEQLRALAEIQGASVVESLGSNPANQVSMEGLAAAQYLGPFELTYTLGIAKGFLPGWGTPTFRVFAGVRWSPRYRDSDQDGLEDKKDNCPDQAGPLDNQGCPWGDQDSDGLTDNLDRCPKEPGPGDNDGCPWGDKDDDGLTDNLDKCIEEPGPKDNFGCPWGDKDKDEVTDNVDQCPEEFGPKENQGCPWGDQDQDGIKDNLDKCPQSPEDQDGFEDEDGCPEVDNDKDGIPDKDDKCPLEPETINGNLDEDGCPDEGKVLVIIKKEKIDILQKVYFATGKAIIKSESYNLLDQVARTIKAHPEIKKIRIEGHTDSSGPEELNQALSEERAQAVRKYIIDRGIEAERMEAVGFGESKPIAPNTTASGREANRRVEFVIVEQ
jgi:outer membrane protein OmpA-like peptidoglycan-associated protein